MMLGYVDVVTDWNQYCQVPESVRLKILNIAQDLVYLSDKGAEGTPKSIVLGVAIRRIIDAKYIRLFVMFHSCLFYRI